jgi:hypothetical protein
MSTPSPILVPSNTLTIVNGASPTGQPTPPNRFILFGSQWLKLQTYVSQALQLPINLGDFREKYGDFDSPDIKGKIEGCINACKSVKGLAGQFGDPSVLKTKIQRDPAYMQSVAPPDEIYGHVVWLANQIQNSASTFQYTFGALSDVLSPSAGTPEQRAASLKLILTGQGGLTSTADDMRTKTNALMKKLLDFDTKISAANQEIQIYAGSSSSLLADVNQIIGKLREDIDKTQSAADEAYKKWRDYTISAVTTSVGIMVLSMGLLWPVAVGLGAGLGTAAALSRAQYNTLMDKVHSLGTDMQKKTRLVTDLTGFNSSIATVAPALGEFKSSLETVEGVWNDIGMNLAYIVNTYSVNQLSDLSWVMQTMKILDAQKKWGDIATTSQQFSQNSLVSYDFSTTYGQKIAVNQ